MKIFKFVSLIFLSTSIIINSQSASTIINENDKIDTCLIEAINNGNITEIQRFINMGANVNLVIEVPETPYSRLPSKSPLILAIKYYIDRKICLELGGKSVKKTTLMKDLSLRSKAIVELLINAGANVNAIDSHGSTALIYSIERDLKDIVEILLDAGAKIEVKTQFNETAMSIALRRGKLEIIELLKAEPERRRLAAERRTEILNKLKTEKIPSSLVSIINGYLANPLTDYIESGKANNTSGNPAQELINLKQSHTKTKCIIC